MRSDKERQRKKDIFREKQRGRDKIKRKLVRQGGDQRHTEIVRIVHVAVYLYIPIS